MPSSYHVLHFGIHRQLKIGRRHLKNSLCMSYHLLHQNQTRQMQNHQYKIPSEKKIQGTDVFSCVRKSEGGCWLLFCLFESIDKCTNTLMSGSCFSDYRQKYFQLCSHMFIFLKPYPAVSSFINVRMNIERLEERVDALEVPGSLRAICRINCVGKEVHDLDF